MINRIEFLMYYFFACFTFFIVFMIYNMVHQTNFDRNYFMILKNGPKSIPSILYYSGLLIKKIVCLFLFPASILIYIYNRSLRSYASTCFHHHYPPEAEESTLSSVYDMTQGYISRYRFHCDYWDSYNDGSKPSLPFFCMKYCPCMTSASARKKLLLTEEAERKYRDHVMNLDDENNDWEYNDEFEDDDELEKGVFMKNYYEILEVREDASQEIIEMAYEVLAEKCHSADLATEIEDLMSLDEAYKVLHDPIERLAYDEQLKQLRENSTPDVPIIETSDTDDNRSLTAQLKERKSVSPLPLKWFNFYSIVWLFLNALGAVSRLLQYFSLEEYSFSLSLFTLFALVGDAVFIVFPIYLFISFRVIKLRTFYANNIFIAVFPAYMGMTIFSGAYTDYDTITLIINLSIGLFFAIANLIYFEKRRFLFDLNSPIPLNRVTTSEALAKAKKYIILSVVLALISGLLTYGVYRAAAPQQSYEPYESNDPVVEIQTSDETIKVNADRIAQYLQWNDFDQITQSEQMAPVVTSSMTYREKFDKWVEVFELPTYDESFGKLDPFNDVIIDSYNKYQDYLFELIKTS